nr:MAG TPA: hypothetical protein [Caudoviricetes sp.]DAO15871.1 MAG TPA: hypothetical protein [Caudoviricetes sp.]
MIYFFSCFFSCNLLTKTILYFFLDNVNTFF